jgi:hypothetical protein
MRVWNRRVKYEDRNRAMGMCTRSMQHGPRDPRSKNLCAACLKTAREIGRDDYFPPKKPVQRVEPGPSRKVRHI